MTLIPIPYIIFFLITIITTCFRKYDNIKAVLILKLYVLIMGIVVFYGLRGFIYTDWSAYYTQFQRFPNILHTDQLSIYFSNKIVSWEKAFVYLMVFSKSVWNNYFFFQFLSFTIDIVLLYLFLREWLPARMIPFAICVFLLFSGNLIIINLLRQSKVILLGAISLKYIYEKKFYKFILLIIVGYLFHKSVILYLPFYFILNKRYSRKLVLLIFVIGNIFFFLQVSWLDKIVHLLLSILPYNRISFSINEYINSSTFGARYGLSFGFLERTISFIMVFHFEPILLEKNQKNRLFTNVFYIYIFIFLYFSEISIILERVTLLFVFGYWILYPQIFFLLSKKKKYYFLIFFVLYGIAKNYSINNQQICMYENCLITGNNFDERLKILQRQLLK